MSADDRKWRAEEDLRTLRRLEEIRSDKSRMAAVKALIQKEQRSLSKVAKSTSSKKAGSGPKRGKK